MLSPRHLRLYVIRPTLAKLQLLTPAAEDLVLGTAIAESGLTALDQVTKPDDATPGPAYGLWQMEEATHDDLWRSVIAYRPDRRAQVESLLGTFPSPLQQLVTNLAYAAAMCRLAYWRQPAALPVAGDLAGYARYWKAHYNTARGAGTIDGFMAKYTAAKAGFAAF